MTECCVIRATVLRCASVLSLVTLLVAGAEAAEPKRVLIIHSFSREFAPYNPIAPALRTDLALQLRQPLVFQDASLDVERGGMPKDERVFVDYLLARNRDAPPDLVVAIAVPAMEFSLRYRDELFPGRPLLVTGVDRRRVQGVPLRAIDGVVSVSLDFLGSARTMLELQPKMSTLALVLGTSQLERFWAQAIQQELAGLADRVKILPPDGLSLAQMRQRVAELPPDSAVLYYMFAVGADGVHHENERALAEIRRTSSAPIFGMFANQLGEGIVGGALIDSREIGNVSAKMAARMLRSPGEAGGHVAVAAQAPAFDWRELDRWGISEARVPAGSAVRFRPPSLWQQHKELIVTGAAILLVQTVLIAALLMQRQQRQRAESAAVNLTGRLLTAHEDERRRLARELHDDLTQRLARLAIDAGKLERGVAADATEMRKDLVRLSEDVHALSYRLHPSVLDDLGLVEALRAECHRVARHGALRVDVDARDVPETVPSETSLCLFRVAQEALNNATRHGRASAVTVLLSPRERGLQLAVSDNGTGFDTTRPRERASLGLASMRERVRLLQGQLDIESTPGRGTTVIAWVPT